MSMTCLVCNHPKRLDIDRQIVQGNNLAQIARKYDLSYDSVYSHSRNHLSRQLVTAYKQKEIAESMNLLSRVEEILSKAEKIFDRNYEAKKDALALKAISEQRSTIELLAKIAAYFHESRAMELQSQQGNYESRRKQEEKAFVDMALDRLNPSEIDLWTKLLEKIHGQTDEEIIPYQETVWIKETKQNNTVSEHDPCIDSEQETSHTEADINEDQESYKPEKPLAVKKLQTTHILSGHGKRRTSHNQLASAFIRTARDSGEI